MTAETPTHRPPMSQTKAPTSMPDARPTSVPDAYDDAVALEVAFRQSYSDIPMDLVPVRLQSATPEDLDLRSAFLLAHVDDQSTIDEIAQYAQVPASEARACFLDLVARGAVALGSAVSAPPTSGVVAKQDSVVLTTPCLAAAG